MQIDGLFLTALAFAGLAAAGNVAGAILAERFHATQRTLSLALHGAAGTVLGVVGVELLPRILVGAPGWAVAVTFAAGGLAFIALDAATGLVPDLFGTPERLAQPLQLSTAMAVDLFNDGLLVGAALTATAGLGLLLALSQVAANVPGGFAANAALTGCQAPGRIRVVTVGGATLAAFAGATIGYLGLNGAPPVYTLLVLSVTSGLLSTLVIEEIIPQAHQGRDARLATVFLIGGFALFTLLAAYVH